MDSRIAMFNLSRELYTRTGEVLSLLLQIRFKS